MLKKVIFLFLGKKIIFDGISGENRILQAYFELINIPFTGSNFYSS